MANFACCFSCPRNILHLVKRFSLLFIVIILFIKLLFICDLNAESGVSPTQKAVTNDQKEWTRPRGSRFWVSKRHRKKHRVNKFAQSSERLGNELPRVQVHQSLPASQTSSYLKNNNLSNSSLHYAQNHNLDLPFASSSHNNQISFYDPGFNFNRSTLYSSSKLNSPHIRSSFPSQQQHSKKRHHHSTHRRGQQEVKKRPNIIFMLTDDQDIELGVFCKSMFLLNFI